MRFATEWLLILIPLLYGYATTHFVSALSPLITHSLEVQIVFFALWLYTGYRFGLLPISRIKAFLWGNSLWLLSFLVFLWQFELVPSSATSPHLALAAQYYFFGFLWVGPKIIELFTHVVNGNLAIIVSYVSMLVVFAIGFFKGRSV